MISPIQIIGSILAFAGFFDLCCRIKDFLQESVFISLRSPNKVLNWQCVQIAHASYVAAKKLYRLSKQLPTSSDRDKSIRLSKEYVEIRHRIYNNLKHSGFEQEEFVMLCRKADIILGKITGKTTFTMEKYGKYGGKYGDGSHTF
ncbi:hypothetical protein KJ633_01230 [bacterium]|nr:hypothetical protein [bacterium]MBU3955063.1 hypothetical protein [bacterium]